MKTLRRVILEGGKNSLVKTTRVALGVQGRLRRGEPTTASERDVLKKYRSTIHGMAAGRGLAKARKAREAGNDSEAGMHAGGAKWNITRGKRWAGRKDAQPENSNTAYPLTAGRVHIHEVNIVKGKLEDGNGTKVKKSFQGSLTQKAIALRDAGKASRASKHSLAMAKRSQGRAAAMRPSKFDGPRIRTKLKKPARGKGRGDPLPNVQLGGTAAERAQKEVGDNPNIYR